jgi:hypothetical protein
MGGVMKNIQTKIYTLFVLCIFAAVSVFAKSPALRTDVSRSDWSKAEQNYVAGLLSDNAGLRQSAAGFLGEYKLKGAIQPLISVLQTDKLEQIRMSAALALITIGTTEAREAVVEASIYDGSEKVAKFCESLLNATNQKLSLK